MNKPKVHSSKVVLEGFINVRLDMVENRHGELQPYSSLILNVDATAVLAQTPDGKWILNREYRHPTGDFLLGCPGGRLEPGEDPLIGGSRELFEETGYWSDEILVLGCAHPFPGVCNQKIYYLLAKNCVKKSAQQLDSFERIETELKTDAELRKEIQNQTSVDAIMCTALYYYSLHAGK